MCGSRTYSIPEKKKFWVFFKEDVCLNWKKKDECITNVLEWKNYYENDIEEGVYRNKEGDNNDDTINLV